MTTPTILFGWLLLGLGLAAIGALFVVIGCSEWAESRARKADEDAPAPRFAHKLTDGVDEFQESWERHVADALAKTEESNVVRLPGRRLRAIPEQGKPGALS